MPDEEQNRRVEFIRPKLSLNQPIQMIRHHDLEE